MVLILEISLCNGGVLLMQTVFCVGGFTVKTRDHLFFACPVSRSVWKTVLQRLKAAYTYSCWDHELEAAANIIDSKETIVLPLLCIVFGEV